MIKPSNTEKKPVALSVAGGDFAVDVAEFGDSAFAFHGGRGVAVGLVANWMLQSAVKLCSWIRECLELDGDDIPF